MPITYRRPGVYLEESLLVNSADTASTFTVGCFIGVAEKGPILDPIRVESWSDYVTTFGGFNPITPPAASDPNDVTTESFGQLNYANFATLQTDPTNGTGYFPGAGFTAGQYVRLNDGSFAHYTRAAMATNRGAAAPNTMFAADTDITAADSTNAAKLAPGTVEVQRITPGTAGAAPTSGTFTLTILGVTTGPIAWNAAPSTGTGSANVKATIDAAIPGNTITVAGGPVNTAFTSFTFTGYGPVPEVTVNTSGLNVGATLTPSTPTPGSGEGFIAAPTSAWTAGQNIWIGEHAFYWNGTAWAAGTAGGGQAKNNNGLWVVGKMTGTGQTIPPLTKVQSYLPFAVYSFFQSGGRTAWVVRATPTSEAEQGERAKITVNGSESALDPLTSFVIEALSVGTWGNKVKYTLSTQATVGAFPDAENIFGIQVLVENNEGYDEVVENFSGLSIKGSIPGTRRADVVINDPAAGSQYIRISGVNEEQPQPQESDNALPLMNGEDPGIPDSSGLVAAVPYTGKIEGPMMVNIVGYHSDISKINTGEGAMSYVSATVPSAQWPDRQDVFIINDSAPPRLPSQSSAGYKSTILTSLAINTGDSYSAAYGPWILIPHPQRLGDVVAVPPGGGVMGVAARVDATVGVFRAPAGVIAGISNAVGVQSKFTDTELGDLNSANVNVIRSIVGNGICVMGARTRKTYGADRYVSARRTLIYIKEVLRRTTQFAVFENNDQRLWSSLTMAADRILRPLWDAGGLKGANTTEAYFIRCDDVLNSPAVIASGEVRMEIGVALQYPAEFVVIRITQYDRGTFTNEVIPAA